MTCDHETMDRISDRLQLEPHPEGGYYRETWVGAERMTTADGRVRGSASLIYFWLPAGEASAWHRVASDEIWLAHRGSVVLELGGDGDEPVRPEPHGLGCDLERDESPQIVVLAGVWQRTLPGPEDALVSCVVSPAFDFADFELDTI